MKISSSRFTIAVHMLSLIHIGADQLTSEQIADSVNTNPVFIRQISRLLKKSGLTDVKRGSGGAYLLKEAGANIHQVLGIILLKAQTAMESILKEVSIKELTELLVQKKNADHASQEA